MEEFKRGDTIICLNNVSHVDSRIILPLTIGNHYIVHRKSDSPYIEVLNDKGRISFHDINRFISLSEYRSSIIDEIIM